MPYVSESKSKQAKNAVVEGKVRIDERTKNLTRRLEEGNIAVINHKDIDRLAAEELLRCKVKAVLNAAKSSTGRYPNTGPSILVESGVILIDDLGPDIMQLREGQTVTIRDDEVYRGSKLVAAGTLQTEESVEKILQESREGISTQIEAFAANTMDFLRQERDLLLDGVGIPAISTNLSNKHVLIVVRGYNYKEDLKILKPYIREYKPVLIGVDGGADAIIEAGFKPKMIVGDMDSVSDKALKSGAELVLHAYSDGRAPGVERLKTLGLDYVLFPATGTSEDVAMLMADEKGAELIVAVGTHATLIEFLDKGRSGMASTFLTRLRVGPKLVDAKGVSKLYQPRISRHMAFAFILVGILSVLIALSVTPAGQALYTLMGIYFAEFYNWFRELVGLAPGAIK